MSSAFNYAIGLRLRHARKLRGLTQSQLAERLGISFQQVQKYEAGANTLSFERVCRLSALLGVPLAEWTGEKPAEAIIGGRQELALLQAFNAIGSDERRTLLCQIARMVVEASTAHDAALVAAPPANGGDPATHSVRAGR